MKKNLNKYIYLITILTSLACVLTSCGNQLTGETYTEMEEQSIYAPYQEEHLSLGIGYEQVAVQNDMIYGVYREAENSTIVYQNKITGEIHKKLPLENDMHVFSIQADEVGVVYFVAEKDGINRFYRVEDSGVYSELTGFDIEQDEKIINEEAKGIYISEKGYYYIWWNAGVPAKELLEEYAKDERVYVYADLIYVMNERFEVVHTEKIPMYEGTRLLNLQLGQDGESRRSIGNQCENPMHRRRMGLHKVLCQKRI